MLHVQLEQGKVIGVGVHTYYIGVFVDKKYIGSWIVL